MRSSLAKQVLAHREAARLLLKASLPYGRKARVAGMAGFSPSYLSRLLSEKPYRDRREPLSLRRAEKIADALHFSPTWRQQLVEHAELSHISMLRPQERERQPVGAEFPEHMNLLLQLHGEWDRTIVPEAFAKLSGRIDSQTNLVLMKPGPYLLEAAQVHLVLHHVCGAMDRHADAIFHARRAQQLAAQAGNAHSRLLGKTSDDILANAIVARAVSYHSLGLNREALAALKRLQRDGRLRTTRWSGIACVHRLEYGPLAERVSLREISELSERADEWLASHSGIERLSGLSVAVAKIRAYVAYYDRARPLTRRCLARADRELEDFLRSLGGFEEPSELAAVLALARRVPLLRALKLLKVYASLLDARGDRQHAVGVWAMAWAMACRGRVAHQVRLLGAGHVWPMA
jgi:transcriptional regulator with XRE-family HTH domain